MIGQLGNQLIHSDPFVRLAHWVSARYLDNAVDE
jgi:hypothetical protein